ncbi:MAG TPA: aldo/keto reductase [Candidatus Binatia bacterium]|nr:aldo/keto reductase [Candidatus Binatia bacterium]
MTAGATESGTTARRAAHADLPAAHFRSLAGLTVSSIGLGTYLGEEDDVTDRAYGEAIVDAVNLGCNFLDTAINYRAQRSERVIGQALLLLERELGIARDQLVVCTKGGYIPFDGAVAPDPSQYVRDTWIRTGVLRPEDVVGGAHVMTPRWFEDQIARSLRNLGVAAVDLYYVHNPETQLGTVARPEFLRRIRAAFELLEGQVAAGRIGCYGVATWNGFRVRPEAREHLSLAELVREAEAAGGPGHRFKAIQLPYNLAMPEAYAAATQVVDGERLTTVEAAERLGVAVIASASMLQGQLSRRLPQALADALPGLETAAQRALQFVRSTPGITSALVGMSRRAHVAENLAVARVEPMPAGVASLYQRA